MTQHHSGRVSLVGDVMIRGHIAEEYWRQDAAFQSVVRRLTDHGAVVANLEMPLSRRGVKMPKWSNLRSDPNVVRDIQHIGIDAVTLANNHMLDFGPEALFDTLSACDDARLPRCGAGKNLEEALQPVMLPINGQRVAVLGVASTLPVGSEATSERPGIAPIRVAQSFEIDPNLLAEQPGMAPAVRTRANDEDRALVCEQIRQLKEDGAYVVVMIHWGVPEEWLSPYLGLLAEYQQPLGHALIDAGADIVCGHHSHTLHPIELRHGRPIFYSLGNFLFERPRAFMEPASFIIEIALGDDPEIGLVPVVLDPHGFPYFPDATQAEGILKRLDGLSEPYGTSIACRDGIGRIVAQ